MRDCYICNVSCNSNREPVLFAFLANITVCADKFVTFSVTNAKSLFLGQKLALKIVAFQVDVSMDPV